MTNMLCSLIVSLFSSSCLQPFEFFGYRHSSLLLLGRVRDRWIAGGEPSAASISLLYRLSSIFSLHWLRFVYFLACLSPICRLHSPSLFSPLRVCSRLAWLLYSLILAIPHPCSSRRFGFPFPMFDLLLLLTMLFCGSLVENR